MSSTRVSIYGVWSDQSDYSEPAPKFAQETESTSDTLRVVYEGVSCATGGTTLDLGNFTTITSVFFRNTDTTNFVTVTGQSNSVAFSLKVPASSGWFRIPEATPGADLTVTADTAACLCDVEVWGT